MKPWIRPYSLVKNNKYKYTYVHTNNTDKNIKTETDMNHSE